MVKIYDPIFVIGYTRGDDDVSVENYIVADIINDEVFCADVREEDDIAFTVFRQELNNVRTYNKSVYGVFTDLSYGLEVMYERALDYVCDEVCERQEVMEYLSRKLIGVKNDETRN